MPFTISTINVRTLVSQGKKYELEFLAQHHNIDVICLQEHSNFHCELLMQEKNQNSTISGVGFLLSPRAYKACHTMEKYTARILVVTLAGNPETTIVCCYSPTNTLENEKEVIQFYKDLPSVVSAVPVHNFLIIGGDFNAQMGPEKH